MRYGTAITLSSRACCWPSCWMWPIPVCERMRPRLKRRPKRPTSSSFLQISIISPPFFASCSVGLGKERQGSKRFCEGFWMYGRASCPAAANHKLQIFNPRPGANLDLGWNFCGAWTSGIWNLILRSQPACLHRPYRTVRSHPRCASARNHNYRACRSCPRVWCHGCK